MSHSIIRVQKMKATALKGIQFHNQREKESQTNPDIRTEDAHLNYDLIHGDRKLDYKKEVQQVISENVKSEKKVRKDAVLLSEFLITSDSSFFENLAPDEQRRYFETAKDFIADNYGEQNIIYATVHNDERTPHMHVGLVPVTDDGRLSAKDVFGNRLQFVKLQDDFNAHVKAHGFDLERGVSSNRKHLDMAKFKAVTAYEAEREATQKSEQVLSNIKEIDTKIKAIEDVKPIQKFGQVLMKNDEYKTLVNYATNGAVAEVEVASLSRQLADKEKEVMQLQEDAKKGQEKLRKMYSGIEWRSKDIEANLTTFADNLAEQKAQELFNNSNLVKKHEQLLQKSREIINERNELAKTYNEVATKYNQLVPDYKLTLEENKSLKTENSSLREQIEEIRHEFSAWKERAMLAFHKQFQRMKSLMKVLGVEPDKLKELDKSEDRIVSNSIKEIEKPNQSQKTMEMER